MIYPFRAILLFPLILLAATTCAQVDGRLFRTDAAYLSGIRVEENNIQKPLAWTGGLDLPRFATVDLNHDGKNDLVIFEPPDLAYANTPRVSNNIKTFINTGTPGNPQFAYAPEYEYLMPYPYLMMKILDYNCDLIPDFIYGSQFLNVCDGYYNSNNNWTCKNCRVVYNKGSNPAPLPINYQIPGIANIDNDNDLDVVAFVGYSNRFELYKDMRYEESLPCDTLKLKLKDNCWGKVQHLEKRAYDLGVSCSNIGLKMTGGEEKTTGGVISVCLFDADGDGDFDALTGDSKFSDIQYLKNGKVEYGYPVDTMITQDTTWHSGGHKLHMASYPTAYWLDIDDDDDNDIVIAPQADENYRSVAYYRNTGTTAAPSFVYQSDTFLVEDMIDAGSDSYPCLYDYNKDGKKDLFIGGRFFQPGGWYKTSIIYLENTSTGTDVSFKVVTRNFLNISSYLEKGAAISIGDLNGDGLDDLVAGRLDGSIICFKNHASGAGAQPDWQLWQVRMKTSNGNELNVGNYAVPCIYDIDNDGKNDLVVGNETGNLTFYRNIGTGGQISFEYKTNNLGNVKVLPDEPFGYSAPYIGAIDNSGDTYLMVGAGSGAIYRYTGFQNGNVTGPYTLLDTLYSEIKVSGERTSVAFGNVFDDHKFELFIGNSNGGVFAYHQVWDVHVGEVDASDGKLEIFPNPANDKISIVAAANLATSSVVQLVDNMGRSHSVPFAVSGKNIDIDISSLAPGIYICRVTSGKDEFKAIFVKQ